MPCGVVVLHHEGITHKGDMFTKFLEPCKFKTGLELIRMRRPRLPAPSKKGAVIDFRLGAGAPPRVASLSSSNLGVHNCVHRATSVSREGSSGSTSDWLEVGSCSECSRDVCFTTCLATPRKNHTHTLGVLLAAFPDAR